MTEISFFADITKTGLPFIVVTGGKFKGLCFLVDTGCTESILYEFVAEHYYDELELLESEGSVMGLDGKPQKTLNALTNIIFAGQETPVRFHLLEDATASFKLEHEFGFQMHGIIGTDVMIANHWMIDVAKQRIIITAEERQEIAA